MPPSRLMRDLPLLAAACARLKSLRIACVDFKTGGILQPLAKEETVCTACELLEPLGDLKDLAHVSA